MAVGALAAVLFSAACRSGGSMPAPGEARGGVPDLRGRRVMVLPVQGTVGLGEGLDPDAELGFALESRGRGVGWVLPPRIREILRRSPGVRAEPGDLPVAVFRQVEVKRVGDPLYGELRRLAALTGADLALLPVEVRYREREAGAGMYEVMVALVYVRSGRVPWFGVMEGEPGGRDDPGTLASAMDALARALLPLF